MEFDPAVVAAAGELAHEREQRALDKDLERKRLAPTHTSSASVNATITFA